MFQCITHWMCGGLMLGQREGAGPTLNQRTFNVLYIAADAL